MNLKTALKSYLFIGIILCAIAGGLAGYLFERTLPGLSPDDAFSTALFVGSILLCILILKDTRDAKTSQGMKLAKKKFHEVVRSQFRSLGKDIQSRSTRLGLLAYFLWATSQYTILVLFTDFQIKYTFTVIMMMCGYLLGIAILGFCKDVKDEKIIRIGFLITIASFFSFFIVNIFVKDNTGIIAIASFFYTVGNAFLSPSMLSLFSKDRTVHAQGKGFGLIVSADSSGFLAGSIVVIIMNYLNLKLEWVFLFSFLCFLTSWTPYLQYEKIRSNAR